MAHDDRQSGGGSRGEGPHEGSERGRRATYDPVTGEVGGSGSGAGGGGNRDEDYDGDAMAGARLPPAGAPRPASEGEERPIDPDEGV